MQNASAVSTRDRFPGPWIQMDWAPTDGSPPQRLVFSELSEAQAKQLYDYIGGEDKEYDGPVIPWEEKEVVQLCWLLLKSIDGLQDPRTPLIEKVWILSWIFTDDSKRAKPFSFDFCVRVMSLSPLSHLPYIGEFPTDDLRDLIRDLARGWMRESVSRFPDWIQELIRANPDFVVARLDKNPQYINQQIRSHESSRTGDLFALG